MKAALRRRGHHDRGFALLIVLWTLVLLTLMVTQMTSAGRSQARLALNLRTSAAAEAAADGAVYQAIFHLLDTSKARWSVGDPPHQASMPDATADVRMTSDVGKINPNAASVPLLEALLCNVGADTRTAQSLAASIANWRFPDAQGQPMGAQTKDYRAAGRDYGPPAAPFETLDEMGLVLGMTPDLLARLKPHLTIYHERQPDPASADAIVLKSLRDVDPILATVTTGVVDESVVTITAAATAGNGSRFTRRATVQLGAGTDHTIYQILEWGIP
jgi:general secretion pathway protein K